MDGERITAPLRPAETAIILASRGMHVIPLAHAQKAAVDRNWTKLRLSVDDVEQRWDDNPDFGVGLLLGTEVEDGVYLVAIDVDRDEELLIARVRRAIPGIAPSKRGAKGVTFICRSEAPLKKINIKRRKEATATIEILGAGQQTVLPPSIHPKGMTYEWLPGPRLPDMPTARDLPLIDEAVLLELDCIVRHPDAKMFLVNDFQPALDGQPGNMHNFGVEAAASMVAFGMKDDQAIARILRAMVESDAVYGRDDRDMERERRNVTEWVKSAREREFETTKKGSETPDVTFTKWMLNDYSGGGCIFQRAGQLMIYGDGWYRPHTPEEFYAVLAHCGNDDIQGLGWRGWKLITSTLIPMTPPFPDHDSHKVCLLNGTLDMDTAKVMPWSKDDHLITQLPFEYDPDARCRRYIQFIADTFSHDDEDETRRAVDTFEEYVAMTMFECHDFHRFLVLEGVTRSGKSVLCRVAQLMHASSAVSSVMAHDFGSESARTAMLGKLVNITGETSTVSSVADDYLKMIVAGDPLQVRHLYHGAYTTVLPTRLIIATNDPLKTKDTSGAVMERMLALPCDNYVPKDRRDLHLGDKLEAERAGILNRMVAAWRRLRDRGKFWPPNSSDLMAEKFQADNNPVFQWIMDRTHQGRMIAEPGQPLPDKVVPYTAVNFLYLDYVEWSKSNGFLPFNIINFGTKLGQLKIPGHDLGTKNRKLPSGSTVRVRNLSLLQPSRY